MQTHQGQNVVNSTDGWKSRPKVLIQNGARFRLLCLDGECKLEKNKRGLWRLCLEAYEAHSGKTSPPRAAFSKTALLCLLLRANVGTKNLNLIG